jgi:hypothetical protein
MHVSFVQPARLHADIDALPHVAEPSAGILHEVRHTELLNQKFVSCLSLSHTDEMRFRRGGPALSSDGRCTPAEPTLGSHAGIAKTVAGLSVHEDPKAQLPGGPVE